MASPSFHVFAVCLFVELMPYGVVTVVLPCVTVSSSSCGRNSFFAVTTALGQHFLDHVMECCLFAFTPFFHFTKQQLFLQHRHRKVIKKLTECCFAASWSSLQPSLSPTHHVCFLTGFVFCGSFLMLLNFEKISFLYFFRRSNMFARLLKVWHTHTHTPDVHQPVRLLSVSSSASGSEFHSVQTSSGGGDISIGVLKSQK